MDGLDGLDGLDSWEFSILRHPQEVELCEYQQDHMVSEFQQT